MIGIPKQSAAAIAGIGVRRFDQLAHEGDPPPRNSDGSVPPREFGEWFRRRLLAEIGIAQDGTAYDYEAERARLTHHQANNAALDEAKKRGELIPAEDVAREWTDMISRARAKLLGLPPRLAAHAMTCATVREAEEFARAEVYAALSELGETPDDDPAADSPGDADALAPAAA